MGRTQVESGSSVGRKPHVPVLKKREEHFSYASRTRYTPPLALPPVKSGSLQAHNPFAPPPPTLWPHVVLLTPALFTSSKRSSPSLQEYYLLLFWALGLGQTQRSI